MSHTDAQEWLRLARLADAAEIQRRGFTVRPSRTMLAKHWLKALARHPSQPTQEQR